MQKLKKHIEYTKGWKSTIINCHYNLPCYAFQSVHFAATQAILNMLTIENQSVDFCKYPKNEKTNISRKHLCGEELIPLFRLPIAIGIPFGFFGLISNLWSLITDLSMMMIKIFILILINS